MLLFEVLTQDGVEQIHRTTMRALREIDINFFHEEALTVFRRAGADVQGNRVRLLKELVVGAIQPALSSVTLYRWGVLRFEGGRP